MPSDNAIESRRATKSHNSGANAQEQEHLPCPRCDSNNTKFCYYNNYNFSQPRHFCKSCRRYWTQGGTLRDIPVGGGSRKNAKRSRTYSSATSGHVSPHSTHEHPLPATPVFMALTPNPPAEPFLGATPNRAGCDVFAKPNLNVCGSFTSLLNNTAAQTPGFLSFGGFGIGIGLGLEEMGRGFWPFTGAVEVDANVGAQGGPTEVGSSWQLENAEGGFVNGDCFSWPDLAISTPGNALK